MKTALTDLSVRALKAPARHQVTVWDKNSPVGVRITRKGIKSFIVMIGRGQRHTIGRVGVISLADAREEARRILAQKTLEVSACRTATRPAYYSRNARMRGQCA